MRDKCVCKYLLPTEREWGKVYFGIYSSRRFLCGEYESSFLSFSLVPRIFLAAWLLRAGTGLNRFLKQLDMDNRNAITSDISIQISLDGRPAAHVIFFPLKSKSIASDRYLNQFQNAPTMRSRSHLVKNNSARMLCRRKVRSRPYLTLYTAIIAMTMSNQKCLETRLKNHECPGGHHTHTTQLSLKGPRIGRCDGVSR